MKAQGKVRILFTLLVLISFGLGAMAHPAWLWLSVLIGIDLVQSAFTGFCPAQKLFGAMEK